MTDRLIRAAAALAMLAPSLAVANDCDLPGRRTVCLKKGHALKKCMTVQEDAQPKKREITIQRDAQTSGKDINEVSLDAGAGRTLRQLLAEDLGAEVEWVDTRLAQRVMSGAYRGSRDVVAQKLLRDFDFAIFHRQSRLQVIVLRLTPQTHLAAAQGPAQRVNAKARK